MSRFAPHTLYAEDQPHAHTILTTHVLYRAFQSGATLGLLVTPLQAFYTRTFTTSRLLRITGISSLAMTGLMIPGLYMRMRGREDIEWKDRSWRLLENRGQVEVDDFSGVGTLVGGVWGGVRRVGFVRGVGAAGVGSMLGVGVYMGWRYGVKGCKWDNEGR